MVVPVEGLSGGNWSAGVVCYVKMMKGTDMMRNIGAFNFLVELIESHFCIVEFGVVEMQPGEVVEENLLQFGFLARIAFH